MSYSISFKVKVQNANVYVPVGDCDANITWNVREMIIVSTGLEWKNEEDNGYVKDIVPHIQKGLNELETHPRKYKKYESPNGWGTIDGCKRFFRDILNSWERFQDDYDTRDLVDYAKFWIG